MLNFEVVRQMLDEVNKQLKEKPTDNLLLINQELLDFYLVQPEFVAMVIRCVSFCEAIQGHQVTITGPAREVALKRLQTLVGETRKWKQRLAIPGQFKASQN